LTKLWQAESRQKVMNTTSRFDNVAYEMFVAEIQEVQSTLLAATTDLTNPLGDLVRAQIKHSQPPIYGATVLAVSTAAGAGAESADLRRKRILLAAALEMLHIALNVHRLLVNAALAAQQAGEQKAGSDDPLDRSFIGSTILAGDYCFSRAAQMAAQTDHPRVVSTFSLALQTVSEELLREQFHPDHGRYDESRHLLQSGAQAAALLVDLPAADEQQAIALSQELASHWAQFARGNSPEQWQLPDQRAHTLPHSWQALYQWLYRQPTNGDVPPSSQQQQR
jgi:octaprenyl-diphosphate synthase